jgi:hypothetical protein
MSYPDTEGLTGNLFRPARRVCACGLRRVDTSDFIDAGVLHGLLHCFPLALRAYLERDQ